MSKQERTEAILREALGKERYGRFNPATGGHCIAPRPANNGPTVTGAGVTPWARGWAAVPVQAHV